MSHELYANGMFANVYEVSAVQKRTFARADIVRKETCKDPYWFARRYYQYKILHLLHPHTFIQVIGATVDRVPQEQLLDEDAMYKSHFSLYSIIAPIPTEHATYVKHMRRTPAGRSSLCACESCIEHRLFHKEHNLYTRAQALGTQMDQIGIRVPWYDESDYCQSVVTDDLFFFEVDNFDDVKIREHLLTQVPSVTRDCALRLLERFTQLRAQSLAVLAGTTIEYMHH